MNELGLKNTEKMIFFFYAHILRYLKKHFVKGENLYILAIATHF